MDKVRVAKAGAVAGVIYGFLTAIAGIVYMVMMKEEVITTIRTALSAYGNLPITAEDLYPMSLAGAIPGGLINGLIVGIILAFVFAIIYNELIGKNSMIKGVCFSVLILIGIGIGEMAAPGISAGLILLNSRFLPSLALGVIFFLAYGYLLGMFYDRFGKPKK
ncbi:MAG: hypothetical protein JW754_02490 [Candidatus Aenigmarchaeota archaeon]|nr:hypothetical protein [Candidatus Aenigmarchaeota archaeon]